jgi:hypothetical protein
MRATRVSKPGTAGTRVGTRPDAGVALRGLHYGLVVGVLLHDLLALDAHVAGEDHVVMRVHMDVLVAPGSDLDAADAVVFGTLADERNKLSVLVAEPFTTPRNREFA